MSVTWSVGGSPDLGPVDVPRIGELGVVDEADVGFVDPAALVGEGAEVDGAVADDAHDAGDGADGALDAVGVADFCGERDVLSV